MSYVDDSAAQRRAQEANHYHPTPWLRKWALVETGTFIQSPLRGDTVLRLPAEWPTAAASCNHVSVTTDNLSGNVLHSGIASGRKEDRRRFILKTYEVHWCHLGILAKQQLITLLTDLLHSVHNRRHSSSNPEPDPQNHYCWWNIQQAPKKSPPHEDKVPQVRTSWTLAPLKLLKCDFIFLSAL